MNRGRGHSYVLDNQKAKGVTTLIDGGIPKPALVWWAGNTVAEWVIERLNRVEAPDGAVSYDASALVDDLYESNQRRTKPFRLTGKFPRAGLGKVLSNVHREERDMAARRGTEVHELAAKLADGEEVEVPDEIRGHVDSYLQFLNDFQPTDALVEVVIVNRRWGYMGTLDLLCFIEGFGWCLIDVKTSRSGIYAETALQTVAYGEAEVYLDDDGAEIPMPKVDAYFGLWVRADGYDLHPLAVDDTTFRIFLYAAEIARWREQDGPADQIVLPPVDAP